MKTILPKINFVFPAINPGSLFRLFSAALLLCFNFAYLNSQSPQGFNYQAIAKDVSGNAIANQTLPVRITIKSDSLTAGTTFWYEEHANITTNSVGLFTLTVGKGARLAGLAKFSDIDWSVTPKFIKTEVNYSGWKTLGTTRLWSVPYAMVANNLGGPVKKLSVMSATANMEEALFEVKNNSGQTVFAVYNEGVRVYVDDGNAKGSKGGFAIGGFGSKAGAPQNLMTVSHDSVRIYVDETAAKGAKGGFAVGGFNSAKGTVSEFMFLTPENYFIGHKSGTKVTTGKYNSTLGYESGSNLQTGWNNIFVGYRTGFTNSSGTSNVFVGNSAGFSNTTGNYNILIGNSAGNKNTFGWGNIILGDNSGAANISGYQNVIIGDLAGLKNTTGYQNVIMGANAGSSNTTGYNNVFIGSETGRSNTDGYYNSFIGFEAGRNNTTGNYNTFLGYQAGFSSGISSYSTSIGYKAGYSLSDWQAGTFVGYEAGMKSTGRQNTFVGSSAGQAYTTGADNVAIGAGAGSSNDYPVVVNATGSRNAFVGYYTGYKSAGATDNVIVGAQNPFGATFITGSYNVYLGVDAGNQSSTGSRNVFIGYQAGLNEIGSDKLYINNNSSATPLLYGDFNLKRFRINGNTYINGAVSSAYALGISMDADDAYGLVVFGPSWTSSGAWAGSDIRLKKNITSLTNSLSKVISLNGVNYYWDKENHPGMGFSDSRQVGLIAQEVEKVVPELVTEGPDGYKSVDYSKVTPLLIEAIKEQQQQIESLRAEIEAMKGKK
jgi:hypothetical protein